MRPTLNCKNSVKVCRENGWGPGTHLVGDEGYGPSVIKITAIGENRILAKQMSHAGIDTKDSYEGMWTLSERDWKKVTA